MHVVTKSMFPLSARDFALVAETRVNTDTGALDYVTTSVVHAYIPESPDTHVRGHVDVGAWILAHKLDKKGVPTTDVVYVTAMDVRGNIPTNAVKAFIQQTPMHMQKVRD